MPPAPIIISHLRLTTYDLRLIYPMHHFLQFPAQQEQHYRRSTGKANKYHEISMQAIYFQAE